jgi:aminopeptidase
MDYEPPKKIIDKYADLLVNFALNSGKGIKKGDVVYISCGLTALPLYRALKKSIHDAGGHALGGIGDDMSGMGRYYFETATKAQLTHFPESYLRGLADQIDHRVAVISDYDVHELDGVDAKKIMLVQKTMKPYGEWLDKKENDGKHTWTLGLYGTPSMAAEANMDLKEYWKQIIHACYLDKPDPKAEWKKVSKEVQRVSTTLTKLQIDSVHMTGKDVDLTVKIGEKRRWLGGSGRNIPSFEVFTSPDWRYTQGWIRFNQPLYRYGSVVEGIELHFDKGRVVKAKASKNQKLLKEMLATDPGASQIGEYSLTDKRLSRITKFMAETLFDENMGGKFGNTHIAVGRSYHDTFDGSTVGVDIEYFKKLGFNESAIHTDMISTEDRTVEATLKNGKKQIIYKNGQFTV